MTKEQFIELMQYRLAGIPTMSDKTKDSEVVSFMIGRAYNQLLGDLSSKGFRNLTPYGKWYYNVEVAYDTDTEIYYSLLPIDISTLIDIKSGVRKIQTMKGRSLEFAPIHMDQISILDELDVSLIDDVIAYVVEKNHNGDISVQYVGMDSNNVISTVKMYLLPPFEVYADDDIINIPAGQDAVIFDTIVKMFSNQPYKDMKDNHNETKYGQ
jgi:hypothetical protein